MNITWCYDQSKTNWVELSGLYKIAPLGIKPPGDLEVVFSNSRFKCFVFDGVKLIGVGRALADGIDCSYICDIAIHPEYQGIGLGNQIVQNLIEEGERRKKQLEDRIHEIGGGDARSGELGQSEGHERGVPAGKQAVDACSANAEAGNLILSTPERRFHKAGPQEEAPREVERGASGGSLGRMEG